MAVRSALVKETLVERICDRVVARLEDELPAGVAGALDHGPRCDREAEPTASQNVAHAGYLARAVETELFSAARAPMPGLAESLRPSLNRGCGWADAAAELAHRLASREPLERPAPGDPDAASWRAPGPGGHVRHYTAERLIAERLPLGALRPADDIARAALKRDFIYGFLIRCCEEAVAGDARPRTS